MDLRKEDIAVIQTPRLWQVSQSKEPQFAGKQVCRLLANDPRLPPVVTFLAQTAKGIEAEAPLVLPDLAVTEIDYRTGQAATPCYAIVDDRVVSAARQRLAAHGHLGSKFPRLARIRDKPGL